MIEQKSPSKHESWRMFNRIAHRYDLLNRLLSFGQDIRWRNRLATLLPDTGPIDLLDLATGTGDVMLTLQEKSRAPLFGVGLDMAGDMLAYAAGKIERLGKSDTLTLVRADAIDLPFDDETFDLTTIAFGIRNVIDVKKALREMHRVIRPGGQSLILEFSLPRNRLLRSGYLLYFRHILPNVGALISGDSYAYRYLNQTVETFPYGEEFAQLMREAGFARVHCIPLTFGVATIYQGIKDKEQTP